MTLRCVLWDFGDTLVDERWMRQAPAGVPEWPAVWTSVVSGSFADLWNLGEVRMPDVIAAVTAELPMSEGEVSAHARWCCTNIRFFDGPLAMARSSALPQAIVTVNPDGFSELVVPHYRLEETFDTIVTSWEERILDKGALAQRALERLDGSVRPGEAMLIDNRRDCLDAWADRGGRTYHFRGAHRFRSDLVGDLAEVAATTRG